MSHADHAGRVSVVPAWLPALVLLVALAVYLVAASRQSWSRGNWSPWRTVSFALGLVLIGAVLLPPISREAHSDLRYHMTQHLLIGMFAPIGLAMGAPVTLLLRSVPVTTARRMAAVLRSRPIHVLSHPMTALALNIGGMYVLYLTPAFAVSMSSQPIHWLIMAHFLAAGYLYSWAITGPDPAPGRPGLPLRLCVLIAGIAAHAYLAKAMYAHLWPRGTGLSETEIRESAQLMYYAGDLAELLLAIALFASWYQHRHRRRGRRSGTNHTYESGRPKASATLSP